MHQFFNNELCLQESHEWQRLYQHKYVVTMLLFARYIENISAMNTLFMLYYR